MEGKPRPNQRLYTDALRRLTPEQRLMTAFELGDLSRDPLWAGLDGGFPIPQTTGSAYSTSTGSTDVAG